MSSETIVLLTALVGFLAALVALFKQNRGIRRDMKAVQGDVLGVHLLINSRMDQMLKLTEELARAKGIAEGQDRPSTRE